MILVQCNPASVENLRMETPVMFAVIPSGNETSGIQLFLLEEGNTAGSAIENARVSITHQGSAVSEILEYNDGMYEGNLDIGPNESYQLSGSVLDHDFTVEIKIPPAIDFTAPLSDTLLVDSTSSGSTIVIVTWTELDQENYSYVVRLDCLEESPQEIPFIVDSGNFASNFNGPQVAAGIIVADTDFRYYGNHRLRVFAIPKSLEKVYFYNAGDIRGFLTNGPDNILGIKGFASGVSVLDKLFYVKSQ